MTPPGHPVSQRGLVFTSLPPLSLYVHIPWCEKKCPYCDFNSHALPGSPPEGAYIDALIADLEQELPEVWGRRLSSIFIGGGTPSLLSPRSYDLLLSAVRARISCRPDIEITLEANPGSSDARKFEEFRAAGINRLSIGVQSFNNGSLHSIGRIHDAETARHAVEAATAAGFDNFNLDLMFGLPGQSEVMAAQDLRTALAFEPPHLSYYQLTVEPNTRFYKYPPPLPDEDAGWQMQKSAEQTLATLGYRQYEVSAYSKPGRACQHNLNYWRFGDYLGIGAGAHGKISAASRVIRSWKVKHPQDYLTKARGSERIGGWTYPSAADIRFEFMLNALRLVEPVSVLLFQRNTGQPISAMAIDLECARADELIAYDGKSISATPRGRRFLNDLLQRFLPDSGGQTGHALISSEQPAFMDETKI